MSEVKNHFFGQKKRRKPAVYGLSPLRQYKDKPFSCKIQITLTLRNIPPNVKMQRFAAARGCLVLYLQASVEGGIQKLDKSITAYGILMDFFIVPIACSSIQSRDTTNRHTLQKFFLYLQGCREQSCQRFSPIDAFIVFPRQIVVASRPRCARTASATQRKQAAANETCRNRTQRKRSAYYIRRGQTVRLNKNLTPCK